MNKYELACAINRIIAELEYGDFDGAFVDDCLSAMIGCDPFSDEQLNEFQNEDINK